jgi:hypothetical protein
MLDIAQEIVNRYLTQKKSSLETRLKYPDGRLIPQPGDIVQQEVPGFFGTPAWLQGVVLPSGKQVRITDGASLVGDVPVGKRYKFTKAWTVVNDPAIKARQEARERAKDEERIKEEQNKKLGEKAIEAEARKLGVKRIQNIREVHQGDIVYSFYSNYENPSKVEVVKVVVDEVESKDFIYENEYGSKSVSGNIANWWK